jgi:hypothetical protein
LKTGDIPANATAPGLPEAREKMLLNNMTPQEQHDYPIDTLIDITGLSREEIERL